MLKTTQKPSDEDMDFFRRRYGAWYKVWLPKHSSLRSMPCACCSNRLDTETGMDWPRCEYCPLEDKETRQCTISDNMFMSPDEFARYVGISVVADVLEAL